MQDANSFYVLDPIRNFVNVSMPTGILSDAIGIAGTAEAK